MKQKDILQPQNFSRGMEDIVKALSSDTSKQTNKLEWMNTSGKVSTPGPAKPGLHGA